MSSLSERLRSCRKSKNQTQKEIAAFLNISERAYQHYELADREPPLNNVIILADYFHVSLDYLTGRTDCPDIVTKDKDGNLIVIEAMRPAGDK